MGGAEVTALPSFTSYTDRFKFEFPFYLNAGMTYEQFWEQDVELVVFYRKAQSLRREEMNTQLWLQGRYVYDAILAASPILHAFAKNGTKPEPYLKEPYPLTLQQVENKEEREKKAKLEANKAKFEAFITQFKGGEGKNA